MVTEGKWERHNRLYGDEVTEHIWCGDEHIADLDGKNASANANLIVSCVNACKSVNPDNPQAVAESIKEMYEALKHYRELHQAFNTMLGLRAKDEDIIEMLDGEMENLRSKVELVLSKADRG